MGKRRAVKPRRKSRATGMGRRASKGTEASLARVLEAAELQIETTAQRRELTRALRDLATVGPSELAKRRYADYQGRDGQWTVGRILRAYLLSPEPWPDEALLGDAVADAKLQQGIRGLIEVLQGRAQCTHHPGRPSAGVRFGKHYCQQCLDGMDGAVAEVDKHVQPKECFVVYEGGDSWAPITGTGCAHWVAHERTIGRGATCLDNKTLKVPDLIKNTSPVKRADVAVNDIWANDNRDHCGLVAAVVATGGTPPNTITIRHDSSAQGGVVEDDFDSHFGGKGTFHR
jgi:hypothetical protein